MHDASLVNRRSQGSRQTDLGDEERPRNSYPLISGVTTQGQPRSDESQGDDEDRTQGSDDPVGESRSQERQETGDCRQVDLAESHPHEVASHFGRTDGEYVLIHSVALSDFVVESPDP